MRWFKNEKEFGYHTDVETLVKNHHYIHKDFKRVIVDLGDDIDSFVGFLNKYSTTYKITARLPVWVDFMDKGSIYNKSFEYLNQLVAVPTLEGVMFTVRSIERSKQTSFRFGAMFLGRVEKVFSRIKTNFYISNGVSDDGMPSLTTFDLVSLKTVSKIKVCLDMYASAKAGDQYMNALKKYGDLYGLVKNFDMVVLSASNKEGGEIIIGEHGDTFGLREYARFLREFKDKTPVIYRGELGQVLNTHKRILEYYNGN